MLIGIGGLVKLSGVTSVCLLQPCQRCFDFFFTVQRCLLGKSKHPNPHSLLLTWRMISAGVRNHAFRLHLGQDLKNHVRLTHCFMLQSLKMSGLIHSLLPLLLIPLCSFQLAAQVDTTQQPEAKKYFVGVAIGTCYPVGNFGATDVGNADAGYAQNGNRYDLYVGYFLNEHITLTAGLRYQRFGTDLSDVEDSFSSINPGVAFRGENGDWQTGNQSRHRCFSRNLEVLCAVRHAWLNRQYGRGRRSG